MLDQRQLVFVALLPATVATLCVLAFVVGMTLVGGIFLLAHPPTGLVLLIATVAAAFGVRALGAFWLALLNGPTPDFVKRRPTLSLAAWVGWFLAVIALATWTGSTWGHEPPRLDQAKGAWTMATFHALIGYVVLTPLVVGLGHSGRAARPVRDGVALAITLLVWGGSWALVQAGNALMTRALYAAQRARVALIEPGTGEPVAYALCQGHLDTAAQALARPHARPDGAAIAERCTGTTTYPGGPWMFFPERFELALNAILLAEQQAGVDSKQGCTPMQRALLRNIHHGDASYLRLFRERQLPVDCPVAP